MICEYVFKNDEHIYVKTRPFCLWYGFELQVMVSHMKNVSIKVKDQLMVFMQDLKHVSKVMLHYMKGMSCWTIKAILKITF